MATALVNAALTSIRPAHASYYGDIDKNNPVLSAAEKEIKELLTFFLKKQNDKKRPSDEASSRGSNWLFDIWNKYEPRLPTEMYYQKLISVGSYLQEISVYDVANRQCYKRYLMTRYGTIPTTHVNDVHEYKQTFFPDDQDMETNILTSKALLGMYMCEYGSVFERDPSMQFTETVPECLSILVGIRTFMQCVMSNETLCWILYNCTIVIYQICRNLMTSGNSVKAVEFLLWAAMSLETSIPLLCVKYLTWRVTLYSAICLAYYDCKAGEQAENFARRSLSKLQELSELERLSGSEENITTQFVFRQATAKMASMVFKRSVFESRRKPKGLLRPKNKNNLKEASQLSWPRTVTERLLSDMFQGSAAQFLATVEALSSSHRRTLRVGPASSDADMLEVTAELFFAGKEIIAGGGGNRSYMASGADHSVLAGVQHDKSLLQLAGDGADGVSLNSVIRFIKLAFCYEQWSTFNTLLDCALIYIKKSGDGMSQDSSTEHSGTELCLALLLVMERVARSRSNRRAYTTTSGSMMPSATDDFNESLVPPPTQGSVRSVRINDDLINLAETILYCINEPTLFMPQGLDMDILIDRDMIVDASHLLWQKCKAVFGKIQSGSKSDMAATLQKTGNPGKWLHILSVVHAAFMWSGIASVDPALTAEVCLRLAVAQEAVANSDLGARLSDTQEGSRISISSATQTTPGSQLETALQVLQDGLAAMSLGRSYLASNDAKHVADVSWISKSEQHIENLTTTSDAFIRDLHVEMLVVHHRISLKLVDHAATAGKHMAQTESGMTVSTSRPPTTMIGGNSIGKSLKDSVGSCLISRAIMFMQKADQCQSDSSKATKFLNRAVATLQNAQEEEKKLFKDSWMRLNDESLTSDANISVPLPPILLSRSDTAMTFKPASFKSGPVKTAWYRIFGRLAAGSNVKVRLNDYFLPGTGEEVPADENCTLRVSGLEPNQRYVFAVAAYTSDGKLIGDAVGDTGNSVVACHPLSVLTTWGHLAQVSYRLGALSVSKQACSVLWDHFVELPPKPHSNTWTSTSRSDFALTIYHLDHLVALQNSAVLLRHVLTSVFVAVETAVKDLEIYCDKFCDNGPFLASQIARLKECEHMLVAMEIAGWLNEPSLVLQAVVQTYGLISPIIQADVYAVPVLQVAVCCLSALQEINTVLRQKRSLSVNESLHHMIAVLTSYISKVTRLNGKNQVAIAAIDSGKRLLKSENSSFIQGGDAAADEQQQTAASKRNKSRKGAPIEVFSNLELAALEERLAEIARENRAAHELTGLEDAAQILAHLSRMKPIIAYRELAKFKRRLRFLEFFVFVLRKALRLEQIDLAIEWSAETLHHLHKRNESLAVNRALMFRNPGGAAVQGDERKYAAVVAEYSKKTRRAEVVKAKIREKQRKFTSLKKGTITEEQEEAERHALMALERHFVEFYRNCVKRKKLRKITLDEMRWRSEFNHIIALLNYHTFLEKIKARSNYQGMRTPLFESSDFIDPEWWSYDVSGTVVVGWNDGSRQIPLDQTQHMKDGINIALEKAAHLAITTSLVVEPMLPANSNQPVYPEDQGIDSPRTQQTNSPNSMISTGTVDPEVLAIQIPAIVESLKLTMLSFRRGLVLAHRGKHWKLLQNVARALFSCVTDSLRRVSDNLEPVLSIGQLRSLVQVPLSMASDFLLDMLVHIRESHSSNAEWKSYAGDFTDVRGGFSLKFEESVDNNSEVNIIFVKRILFHTIQVLHFESRWEQLVDLCLRFSALTDNRYCDIITPLLVHAQHQIKERVQTVGGDSHPQPHFTTAVLNLNKQKVENKDFLLYKLKINPASDKASTVGVGGYIDPASHDVYGGGKRALALSCVPFDTYHSMNELRQVMSRSQYISRALQHSRKLMVLYLASQHNSLVKSRKSSTRVDTASSCVDFSSTHEQHHNCTPPDICLFDFTSTEVTETFASSQLSTVIESYNRTIELLVSHNSNELVSQASNELGDLYYHQGNVKAATKWWKSALDQILKCKDSLRGWRTQFKNMEDIPTKLLNKCGIWGCLLAVSIACKIGEFSASDIAMKTDCCLLGAALVRAIFRSSLPHPTSDVDYASYEISPLSAKQHSPVKTRSSVILNSNKPKANCVITGIDLFSDRFRCDVQTLVASLHWLCDSLINFKFSLAALPALSFYQYLATFVCRDVVKSVQCRSLRLSALTELYMFKEANAEALNILYGIYLPHATDTAYRPPDNQLPTVMFNTDKPIEDDENLKAMEVLASKRLPSSLAILYGPHLTCEVTLRQAKLLSYIAACIPRIPQKPTAQDLQFVSPDFQAELRTRTKNAFNTSSRLSNAGQMYSDDVRSTISAFSNASASKYINKLFTKRDKPMGQQLLKGMLLAVAENLTATLSLSLESSSEPLMASELWLLVNAYYLLSEINQQRQLSTISASNALTALKLLRDSSIFAEVPIRGSRKLRSALRKNTRATENFNESTKRPEYYEVLEHLYRTRLNARLWLEVRLRLCQALATQVKGLGKVGDNLSENTGLLDHSQAQLYCAEGLAEAEACNDVEMQAFFLIQGTSLDGISVEESKHMLEDATSSLDDQVELSHQALLKLVHCTTQLADLNILSGGISPSDSVSAYRSAHSVLMLKAMQEGETIVHCESGGELSTLAEPILNVYSPHLQLLAHIKLRIANSVLQTLPSDDIVEEHTNVTQLLTQAQYLCSQGVVLETQLQAEIQHLLGKVKRFVLSGGFGQTRGTQHSLNEAIRISSTLPSDLHTLRKSYIESSLVDLVAMELKLSEISLVPEEVDRASSSPSVSAGTLTVGQRSFSLDMGVVSQPLELTQAKLRIATALFSAYHIACNVEARAILPGNPQVTCLKFNNDDRAALPDFVVVNLSSDHSNLPVGGSEERTVDSILAAIRSQATGISWIHVLTYNVLLQRKTHLGTAVTINGENHEDKNNSLDDDLTEAVFATVRTPLNSADVTLKLSSLHEYLSSRLPSYSSTCNLPNFPQGKSFVALQWYKDSMCNCMLMLWCVHKSDGTVDCARSSVSGVWLNNLVQRAIELKRNTEEHFGRKKPKSATSPRKKTKPRNSSEVISLNQELDDEWKELVTGISNLVSGQNEPSTELPFSITFTSAQSVLDLLTVGCCFETKHPLYTWMLQLLSPA